MTYRALATEVHSTHASISRLLETDQRTSRPVDPISKLTGIPVPSRTVRDETHARWIDCGDHLRAKEPEAVRDLVDALDGYDTHSIEETMRRMRIAIVKLKGRR